MKFEIASIALFLSIACLTAEAFCPEPLASRSSPAFVTSRIAKTTSSRLYSQWDEEEDEEEITMTASPTFEQAGEAIGKEDDKAAMDDMGDFDASSTYNPNDVERYREAIRKRTEALGMEKKTPEEIAAEQAMKAESMAREGDKLAGAADSSQSPDQLSQMLDLSQISSDAPRGPNEDLPAMMYNPADDMTDEEMAEADPIGLKPWNEQIAWVLSKSKFPSALSALGETLILVVTVTVTATVITQWDELMRQCAFNFGMVPRPEEVASSMEGMIGADDILGMGGNSNSGADMLKMLQEGSKALGESVKDGSLKDILLNGDVPQDL